jgi:hypothetical protein
VAKITLQLKGVASIVITTAASVSWGIAGRRFDSQAKSWALPASFGLLFLAVQVGLLFIESKEEEELSLSRTKRLAIDRHSIMEREKLSKRIQHEIEFGNPESAKNWESFRRSHYEE